MGILLPNLAWSHHAAIPLANESTKFLVEGAMQLQTVDSSMVHAIGYEATSQTLEVVFTSGKVYQYFEVPEAVYAELRDADSIGGYMRDAIIDCYPCRPLKQRRR